MNTNILILYSFSVTVPEFSFLISYTNTEGTDLINYKTLYLPLLANMSKNMKNVNEKLHSSSVAL